MPRSVVITFLDHTGRVKFHEQSAFRQHMILYFVREGTVYSRYNCALIVAISRGLTARFGPVPAFAKLKPQLQPKDGISATMGVTSSNTLLRVLLITVKHSSRM